MAECLLLLLTANRLVCRANANEFILVHNCIEIGLRHIARLTIECRAQRRVPAKLIE